jgi:hypothetical protein
MTENNKKLNIYQRLAIVRAAVPYLQKSQKGQQYQYVGSSDVLGALHSKINEVGVQLVPSIISHKVTEQIEVGSQYNKYTKQNDEKKRVTYFTELDMVMKWVNNDDPSDFIECPWYAQGVDIAGEKGVGKALTYAEKYFLLKYFNIATDKDDPDRFQEKMDKRNPETPTESSDKQSKSSGLSKAQTETATNKLTEFANTQGIQLEEAISKLFPFLKIKSKLNALTPDEFGVLMNYLNKH